MGAFKTWLAVGALVTVWGLIAGWSIGMLGHLAPRPAIEEPAVIIPPGLSPVVADTMPLIVGPEIVVTFEDPVATN